MTVVHNFTMFKINEHSELLNMLTKDREILDKALIALQKQLNLRIEEKQIPARTDRLADACIRIHLPGLGDNKFLVDVKATLTETIIPRIAHEFGEKRNEWILVTRHVNRQLAMTLKDLGLQFIDTAGNAYIRRPPAVVMLLGNPKQEDERKQEKKGMPGAAGLRVLFALLCKRELRNANYREITTAANVALGTVAGTMQALGAQGYLVELKNGERKLLRGKELLEKWAIAYAEKLRPKGLIGRYEGQKPDFWQQADLTPFHALWGGETAAFQLTRYLRPEITTIYARKPVNDLIVNLKLRKDEEGDIEIREQFWTFTTMEADQRLVPPLLVYADLTATGDARNMETAIRIYGEYLERHLGEN